MRQRQLRIDRRHPKVEYPGVISAPVASLLIALARGRPPRREQRRRERAPRFPRPQFILPMTTIDVMPAESALTHSAHLLPCEIEYSGPAIVSAYFKPTTGKRGLEAAFRGRALQGVPLALPAGYTGAVLQDIVNTPAEPSGLTASQPPLKSAGLGAADAPPSCAAPRAADDAASVGFARQY